MASDNPAGNREASALNCLSGCFLFHGAGYFDRAAFQIHADGAVGRRTPEAPCGRIGATLARHA
jgi:hypothetical protein